MNEIWKKIDGFDPTYEVSDLGRVRTLNYSRTGKAGVIRPFANSIGSLSVSIKTDRGLYKQVLVHRLVAIAFLGYSHEKGRYIIHNDGDKTNNSSENLSFVDKVPRGTDTTDKNN